MRAHGRTARGREETSVGREGGEPVDLLAAVREEMAAVRRRLIELASPAPMTFRPVDPMPPQRLKQLKARITVASGWGERGLAPS